MDPSFQLIVAATQYEADTLPAPLLQRMHKAFLEPKDLFAACIRHHFDVDIKTEEVEEELSASSVRHFLDAKCWPLAILWEVLAARELWSSDESTTGNEFAEVIG